MSSVNISADLIHKYDVLAPRYTSYPAAPQFDASFGERQYHVHAEHSNANLLPKDLSIYVHIPFCNSLCYFCGCNKVITQASNKKVSDYLDRLFLELSLRGKLFSDDRLVTQIHFGGGTPNFLSLEQIADILDQIAIQFHLDLPSNLEISIELDPRNVTPEDVSNLAGLGFSRFSIGVQDFSPEVQKAVNREQVAGDTLEIIAAAMSSGKSVNVDLITGLPKQTLESFTQTLERVVETGVTRVAAYSFAYLPQRIKAQRLINQSDLPDTKQRFSLTKLTRDVLLSAGYQHIGMDHYALPSDPLAIAQKDNSLQRNFQGYTTHRDTDLIGVGASAISKFDTAYSQNTTTLSMYNEIVDRNSLPIVKGISLSDDDRIRAEVIQQIMCRNSVDLSNRISRFTEQNSTLKLKDYFKDELPQLNGFITDQLIIPTQKGFDITEKGRYFMRPIAAIFDRYLSAADDSSVSEIARFSRTV